MALLLLPLLRGGPPLVGIGGVGPGEVLMARMLLLLGRRVLTVGAEGHRVPAVADAAGEVGQLVHGGRRRAARECEAEETGGLSRWLGGGPWGDPA
jgi:hypothetical protein